MGVDERCEFNDLRYYGSYKDVGINSFMNPNGLILNVYNSLGAIKILAFDSKSMILNLNSNNRYVISFKYTGLYCPNEVMPRKLIELTSIKFPEIIDDKNKRYQLAKYLLKNFKMIKPVSDRHVLLINELGVYYEMRKEDPNSNHNYFKIITTIPGVNNFMSNKVDWDYIINGIIPVGD